MCGCIGHTVCGYHTQLIADLIDRLNEAEAAGDDDARSLRGELASFGLRAEIVAHKMKTEASR
ncbi:hypothetical protein AB0I89_24025 [Micromonospora sp. NPDC049801]|uniref:hypothetical protein n=1 Tax=unclassified Micromonospora TaxID=2617518 RepID=UPI0033E8C816